MSVNQMSVDQMSVGQVPIDNALMTPFSARDFNGSMVEQCSQFNGYWVRSWACPQTLDK
jgi:hypothetical protein